MIRKMIVMLVAVGVAVSAMAAFVPPTQQQINQAAANPASISALLTGANAEQAANVIKAVMASILSGSQPPAVKQAAVVQLVNTVFAGLPAQNARMGLARALGAACGGAPIISGNPAVVSAIQETLGTMGTPQMGSALAAGFGETFSDAVSAIPHEGDKASKNPPVTTGDREDAGNPPPAPKPPDAPGYPNQPL